MCEHLNAQFSLTRTVAPEPRLDNVLR